MLMAIIPGASGGSGSCGEDLSRACWVAAAEVRKGSLVPQHAPASLRLTISTVRHLTALLLADLQHRVDTRSEEANRPTERYAISRVLQIREAAQFDERVAERSVSSPRTLPTRPQSGATSSQQPRSCRRRSYTRPRRGCGSRLGLYPPASPGKLVLCRSPPVCALLNRALQGRLRGDRMR
jgi:hypothetical protein